MSKVRTVKRAFEIVNEIYAGNAYQFSKDDLFSAYNVLCGANWDDDSVVNGMDIIQCEIESRYEAELIGE